MKYKDFKNKLQTRIFGVDLNLEILTTVIENPDRYIGLFRVTNAKTKLIQNITQSCEIKFGDFLEDVLTEYIAEMGYENLSKQIGTDEENNILSADQVFQKNGVVYLIEQKVRDDHDSTKKRGQYSNFVKKIKCLKRQFPKRHIVAAMWFSDSSLKKNRKYYTEQINNNTDNILVQNVYYGEELFTHLFQRIDIWEELISHLKQHKSERSNEILNVPDFDTSTEIRVALLQLKQEQPCLIKKLLSNQEKFLELRKELFPTGKNLEGLQ
ncbi:HpyAIV family type II restriction enzyme [Kingella kingae]|uniref:HpyAIV family type II restriction enzyme n=1 Tax=Kingella kingae TaxID=504 RepID=UPI002554849D|nr:hypothetical protein [Kingella kingae]MDK4625402.1 hypothetical protein [Kingella kingae]MDK4661070.1 hypothetical protein [Kingella kingae]MDK4669001.1 hypothetical protein [Kingella kingae]MDK4687442.1 hypothetical protein [Kingella kingae]